jgi:CspA family cold shock protein
MIDRIIGTVKWFNSSNGYDFLFRLDSADVIVHYSGILSDGCRTHKGC